MRKANRTQKDGLPRGIFILPNIFTTLNLFCGFYAVISIVGGSFVKASIAIIIGCL